MTIGPDGTFDEDTKEQVLDAMIADAKEYWGEDLKDQEESAIRYFYEPIAERFALAQKDLGNVLASAQIDNAEGAGLDLLTSLIGIRRRPSRKATGTVTFYHNEDTTTTASRDYTIPSGTLAQTSSDDPVAFETTDSAVLASGTASVDIPVKAINSGIEGNTGANTIIVMPDPPLGVRACSNAAETTGGKNEENDTSLRSRAKETLGKGSRASAPALINTVRSLDGVKGVSIFLNDTSTDNTGTGGLPDHSFELVVQGGNASEIGDTIMKTKAAGDNAHGGVNGTENTVDTTLPNGQTHPVTFSTPVSVDIYVDVDLKKTDEYEGSDEVRNSIVRYIGGLLASKNDEGGEILVGDNVLYGRVEYAIRDVDGVYDINSLTVGTSDNPTSTTDVTIADNEIATTDGTDTGFIDVTTEEVTF